MELITLLAFYLEAVIIVALLWIIYTLQEDLYWKDENIREEREKLLTQFAHERKDLYDRLQAGTLPSYKEHTDAPNEVTDTPDGDIVSLEDAKEEIMNG